MRTVLMLSLMLITTLAVSVVGAQNRNQRPEIRSAERGRQALNARTIERIRKRLVTLPYSGAFDWLQFVPGADGTVILQGQVVRPSTRRDAESRVRDIEGITRVVNRIEVLPVSFQDDRLRRNLYYAIYNYNSPLFRYSQNPNPPIRIIVKRGHAVLKGVVSNRMDSQLAYFAARSVPGLFSVSNQIQIERG
jgi:hyperosmotically inducible periplasmic protein